MPSGQIDPVRALAPSPLRIGTMRPTFPCTSVLTVHLLPNLTARRRHTLNPSAPVRQLPVQYSSLSE